MSKKLEELRSQVDTPLKQLSEERMCICTPCLNKTAEECVVVLLDDEEDEVIGMYFNTPDNSTHLKVLHGQL